MSKKRILVIDGENIVDESLEKLEKVKCSDGKGSGGILGFFRWLDGLLDRWEGDEVIISFDNGECGYRDGLLGDYKGDRKNIWVDYECVECEKGIIMGMVKVVRIKYVFDKDNCSKYEGDDLLG